MTIRHHPDDATLMSYAAGSLPQAFAAVVAAHLGLCRRCREEVAALDLVGAALIDTVAALPTLRGAPHPQTRPVPPLHSGHNGTVKLPLPLADLVAGRPVEVAWQPLARGLWHYPISLPPASMGGRLRLLKASPGFAIPEHGHRGAEMTLVLQGAYRDQTGEYRVGDVADLDEAFEHMPIADGEAGCVCALASELPPRFKGLLLRLAQPFSKL